MYFPTKSELACRPAIFRYVYFLMTSCSFKSFRTWRREGEPNPFVGKTYRQKVTERVEFVDIFGDDLEARRPKSKQP